MCRLKRIYWLLSLVLPICSPAGAQNNNGQINDQRWQAQIEDFLMDRPDTALVMLQQSWQLASMESNKEMMAWVLKRKGTLYMYLSDNEQAIDNYLRALALYREIQDSSGIAGMYMNLGNVADAAAEKIDFYKQSIEWYKQLGQPAGVAKSLVNVGTTHLDNYEYELAQPYFEEALKISSDINAAISIASSTLNLAIVYEALGEPAKGIRYIKKALRYYEDNHNPVGMVYGYYNLGQFYLRMAKLDSCEIYINKTLQTAQEGFVDIRRLCYEVLKTIEVERGNYRLAVMRQHQRDSMASLSSALNNARLFARMETEHQVQLKEGAIEKLDMEIERSRSIKQMLIGLLGSLIGLGGLSVFLQRDAGKKAQSLLLQHERYAQTRRALAQRKLQVAELEKKKLDARLQYTQAELTQFALNFVRNNEIIEELGVNISRLRKSAVTKKEAVALSEFKNTLLNLIDQGEAKSAFIKKAVELNNEFITALRQHYPRLTKSERELLILIMLRLNYKEIASIYGVKPSTVVMKRYKVRRKLGMKRGETFDYFVRQNISQS